MIQAQKPCDDLLKIGDSRIYGHKYSEKVYVFINKTNSKKRIIIRFLGRDEFSKIKFDTFRTYPDWEANRYAPGSAYDPLTQKQFEKKFKNYNAEFAGHLNDEEWEKFLESTYYLYLFQKLL